MNKLVLFLSLLALIGCKPSPKIVWRFQTQAPVYASPSIAGNLLVVGSQDHFLYALDLRTGKLVWKQDLGERIVSKPWIHDRAVYIGSGNGDFDCLDLATGRVRWKFKTGTFIHYDPCGDEDSVYFANNGGRFYKLNKEGKEVWSYKTGESHNWGQCVLYKNLVIATAWDGYCYALDRLSGNLVWRVSSG